MKHRLNLVTSRAAIAAAGLMVLLWLSAINLAQTPKPAPASPAKTPAFPASAPDIWEAPLMPQPFEAAPLRPIAIPPWVAATPGVGYTLSVQRLEDRKRSIEAGVTISEMGFVDPLFVYYDSKFLKRRNPHVAPDGLTKEIAEYRRLGLKILAVYPPTLQGEIFENHPDWRRIGADTTQIPQVDMKKHPHGGMLCALGPYGDHMIEILAEILTKFDVDAFSFDGLHYAGVCYCQHCRADYRKQAGAQIPAVNMNDPAFRRYQHWADRRMEAMVTRMQARLKAIKPSVALITWSTNAGRFGHFRDIPRNMSARLNLLLDAPDQEFWMDESNRGASIVPAFGNAYMWAVTNHRVGFSEPYLMSHANPYGKDSFPDHEILRRVLLASTWGVHPSLAIAQPSVMKPGIFAALAELKKRREFLLHRRPMKWAAMLVSDNTRVFYGRDPGQVEERYLSHPLGFFRMAAEEHLPVTLINDWNLNEKDLAGYSVLILPNVASMDERQAAAVRQFVSAGGGLVATADTSLCDEFGDRRSSPLLADLLGIKPAPGPAGLPATLPAAPAKAERPELDVNFARNLDADYWLKRKNIFDLRLTGPELAAEPRLSRYVPAEGVLFKGPAAHVTPLAGARVLAHIQPRDAGGGGPGFAAPAVVYNTFGKGRSIYLAAGIDSAYYQYAFPYHRLLMKRAVELAAGAVLDQPVAPGGPGSAPLRLQAPMCVQAAFYEQQADGRGRLLIHLFNDINTVAGHAKPDDDIPLREETLPVHDLILSGNGPAPARVRLEPDGGPLAIRIIPAAGALPAGWQVTIPKLIVHAVVVIEPAP